MNPVTLLGLVICNVIWSANPVMGKVLLSRFHPFHLAWLRFASALFAYVVLSWAWPRLRARGPIFPRAVGARDFGLLFLLGFCSFSFAPLTQSVGLASSAAIDNALIVAMEPLLTVFIAALLIREPVLKTDFLGLGFSVLGFSLLSGLAWNWRNLPADPRALGNVIMVVSLLGESCYSSLGRSLMPRHSPVSIFGGALALGVAILTLAALSWAGVPDWSRIDLPALGALLWLGPLGTTATYLFWMIALVRTPVPVMAVTLFLQPVVGSILGSQLLGERLGGWQWIGGLMIVLSVGVSAFFRGRTQIRPRES